ncbi:Hypothetical protein NTJ_07675 [Nesidiocoris tenuis]|uniref:Uncharacterized protein n=1 Tax=Nesidiocoris tenuis TaxID=355587 RepID=A0ABN7ARM7_9HEMI|nr:Hypothetical protein NTJ_07675 [Nesidiocoris tenuis]
MHFPPSPAGAQAPSLRSWRYRSPSLSRSRGGPSPSLSFPPSRPSVTARLRPPSHRIRSSRDDLRFKVLPLGRRSRPK